MADRSGSSRTIFHLLADLYRDLIVDLADAVRALETGSEYERLEQARHLRRLRRQLKTELRRARQMIRVERLWRADDA